MLPHPLTNFEIQKYCQSDPKLNGVYSRNNLPKIKNGVYVINLDEYKSIEAHRIPLYVFANNIVYFEKHFKKFIGNKNIIANIYIIQAYDSIIYEYFCIGFINFMLKGKSLFDCKSLFSPNDYERNDKLILKYFQ